MSKKQDREGRQDRFFALYHYMLRTDAWRALSPNARAVYVLLGSRYNGGNNGRIALSVREAASECNIANNTANRTFKELISLGFIEETRHGGLSCKTRIASEWRLTAHKCDLTGALKTNLFMHRGSQARDHRQPRSRPQPNRPEDGKRKVRLSQSTDASVSNDATACLNRRSVRRLSVSIDDTVEPVLGGSPVSNDDTHVVYQEGSASDVGLAASSTHPPSNSNNDARPENGSRRTGERVADPIFVESKSSNARLKIGAATKVTLDRQCEACGGPVGIKRADARFCSATCQKNWPRRRKRAAARAARGWRPLRGSKGKVAPYP